MQSAFIFRHQHGGFDTNFVFSKQPTDEQMSILSARADAIYGPGWSLASEVNVIDDDTVPDVDVPEPGIPGAVSGLANLDFVCSGVGSVLDPELKEIQ
jgi:hypothetical protein